MAKVKEQKKQNLMEIEQNENENELDQIEKIQ